MNYHYADWIYAKYGWGDKKTDLFFRVTVKKIVTECEELGIDCRFVY
jgi:hypothetical protein